MKTMQRMTETLVKVLLAFATGLWLLPQCPNLHAQETTDEDDEITELSAFEIVSDEDRGYLKTNAVTATRINAPIIEIPISVSVISKELLEDVGTRNTNQLFNYSASVKSSFDSPSNPLGEHLKIRGFGTSFI